MALTQISTSGIKDGTITGTDLATNIDLVDNQKLRIGTGNDLQIYHNGVDTYLEGSLRIGKNDNVRITDAADNTIIRSDGTSAYLAHEGTDKLQTTSAGIDITGDITATGRVLIGTTTEGISTGDDLTISGSGAVGMTIRSTNSDASNIFFSDGTSGDDEQRGILQYHHSDNSMRLFTNAAERMRIDSSGRVLIGHTSNRTIANHAARLQLQGTDYQTATFSIVNNANAGNGAFLFFASQRSGSAGGSTVVQNGDAIGSMRFYAGDGTDINSYCAEIKAMIDGTPGSNDVPGRITFATTSDGSSSPDERMRIDSSGDVSVKTGHLNLENATATNSRHFSITNASGSTGWTFGNGITASAHQFVIYDNTAGAARMLIDSSGKVNVGGNTGLGSKFVVRNTAHDVFGAYMATEGHGTIATIKGGTSGSPAGTITYISFQRNDGNTRGSITNSGSTQLSFNTSSDYRLKENVVAISDGITRLKTLKPSRFNFKEEPNFTVDGFIAHEVTAVPESITGTKDEVDSDGKPIYQGIDQSKLVPLLVAALQEAIVRIEALEAS